MSTQHLHQRALWSYQALGYQPMAVCSDLRPALLAIFAVMVLGPLFAKMMIGSVGGETCGKTFLFIYQIEASSPVMMVCSYVPFFSSIYIFIRGRPRK